ncbi:hypothetical protein D3C87_1468360 [compost metagenome]
MLHAFRHTLLNEVTLRIVLVFELSMHRRIDDFSGDLLVIHRVSNDGDGKPLFIRSTLLNHLRQATGNSVVDVFSDAPARIDTASDLEIPIGFDARRRTIGINRQTRTTNRPCAS